MTGVYALRVLFSVLTTILHVLCCHDLQPFQMPMFIASKLLLNLLDISTVCHIMFAVWFWKMREWGFQLHVNFTKFLTLEFAMNEEGMCVNWPLRNVTLKWSVLFRLLLMVKIVIWIQSLKDYTLNYKNTFMTLYMLVTTGPRIWNKLPPMFETRRRTWRCYAANWRLLCSNKLSVPLMPCLEDSS